MANDARGAATVTVGGKEYRVAMTIGVLAEAADELGVETFDDFAVAVKKLRNMPKVVAALLRGNGHEADAAAIGLMHPFDYLETVIPVIFGSSGKADEAASANPPTPAPNPA
jgi:hypothetical protein